MSVLTPVLVATWLAAASIEPVVDSIDVIVEDVFEDNGMLPEGWGYRLANRLHVRTKERIIRQELLFVEGEPVSDEALAQTERNLRALPFVRRARIQTTELANGRLHVRVVASDAWSTVPEFRIAKVGNVLVWSAGAAERNLLGYGKQLRVSRSSDIDRDQTFLSYRDPRVARTRFASTAFYSDASDGHHVFLSTVRPFFAIDTAWSLTAAFEDFDRLDPLYDAGERVADLRHTRRRFELDAGRAVHRAGTSAVRLHGGYVFLEDEIDNGLDLRRFGMVRVGVSSVGHDFLKLTHINRFERPEDINLGSQAQAFVGWSTPGLGGEDQRSRFYFLAANRGLRVGHNGFFLGHASWQARDRNQRIENSMTTVRLNFIQKLTLRRLILAKIELRHGHELDPEVQVRLGAESGLRGYPVRQFNGNRAALASIEGRWFLADDVADLVSVGVAAFFDSGYAWPDGEPMRLADFRSDVGASLLLGSSRGWASQPGIRIDFAYALDPLPGVSRWLVSAGSRITF